jgi:amino acid adenylation domain-containing protein
VISLGGATEGTVWSIFHPVETIDEAWLSIPYGRPLDNNTFYILDRNLELVPPGVVGDLYIGGIGVARGYAGDPEKTAASYLPDPFSGPGGRLYRTGDLGRMLPEGEIEFLGRSDHQVKVRGFRIELGEIESQLARCPGVREAAVLARSDRSGQKYLCAYVVGGEEAMAAALREELSAVLPGYMVPDTFVFLAALPLTANGKIDRRALPEPEVANAAGEAWVAPAGETEVALAEIWEEVLGLSAIGATQDFFALGGHSLTAIQVLTRVRRRFEIELPLPDFFENPTIAGLAGRVEAALRAGAGRLAPPLLPVPRQGPLPLSFAQRRLWFIDQLEPESPLYNIAATLRVEGSLDAAVLALCFDEIVRRHEVLRTVFVAREGSPVQVIQPAEPFPMPIVDLEGLPESARETLALTLTGDEAARPFDLARGPLLRGLLLRLAEGEHLIILSMHHIVSDGWSMDILVREIATLYAAFAEGRPSPLPELVVQYADFAVWQHSWLRGEVLEGEIAFWRSHLAGLPPLLELPTDRPRPAVQSFRGATRPVRLPAELTRRAEAFGRREGATLFMVLLAGFQALLARTSGQDDLAVGSPVAGRDMVETERLIGFFVNMLVLHGDLAGKPSFRELLGRVRGTALAAYMHQDLPFEKLVEELALERSLAHTPLFQVVLVLQNASGESLETPGLSLRPVSVEATTAKFDLTLNLVEHSEGLSGTVEYATDLFDAATVDRLIGHFERQLAGMIESPEQRIGELPMLSPAERHQVLAEWNDTALERGEPTLIHEPFEAWAKRAPGAVAAIWKGEKITYGQLEERANGLAHRLAQLGIGPSSLVGIHLRRGPDMIVALLAVLKAGAAYVPLEIGHPPARLRWILDTLEISCVLTETAQLGNLPALPHAICLDTIGPIRSIGPIRPIFPPSTDDLAYIIFTSGSTGTPKGVMVRHRPVVNLLRWAYRAFAFSPTDRVLFVTSLSFDLSVFDIFGLLGAGGSIRIADEEEIRDPERLLRALGEEPITFWDSAPAALEQTVPFLASMDPRARPSLRLVFLSGDWIPVALPDRIRERFPEARVVALGGATEATVWSNVFAVERVEPSWTSIPYGRPIENARYHVLDADFAPCPVGIPGDLYIGGDCLADGYAREPVLTAHKFLPDPWSTIPGGRLYRTGDRARYRPDGNLEFLGRLDHQVKIRGFRIELGEIETALATLPGVREAVVVVRSDGDRRLVAYVVGDVVAEEMRRSLRERLPEYMVPAAFVMLAALPITANGKVDRKALPAPEWHGDEEEDYLAPRTPVEEILAGIWSELLGLERVGADSHFFDLGGHSLLATQMLSRLRSAFDAEIALRVLFEVPRLADLAARVEEARRAGAGQSTPPLVPMPRQGPLPLSFAQQRLWLIDQLEPGSPLYNIPAALRVEGPLDGPVLALCLGETVRRHEALRTVFAAPDGSPVQVVQPAQPFSLPVVDLTGLPERAREALALTLGGQEAARPFDLMRGPLLRSVLLRLAEGDHVLALTMHHIASDGWSMGILVREVAALYAALAAGRPSPLPDLPVQYADFALWQSSWLQGEVLERETAWWRQQLAGLPALLELPTDRLRPAAQSFRGSTRPMRLPAGLTRHLAALGRREGATLFMVLLAGLQALLARTSGQDDLAVGSPAAGRNRMEVEGLIGFFVNTLVLRGDLAGEPTSRELVGRIRETTLAAHMHQDVPFEKLVEELAPERSLAHAPLFQVMLVLQNVPVENLEIRDLRLRPVSVKATTAKFDLTLSLTEHDGELIGMAEHATDLFDATTIDRLVGHFERLLAGMAEEPERRISDVDLLTAAEALQLRAWNETAVDYPLGRPLHSWIEDQVQRCPEAVALAFEGEEMTYGELDRRADRLACQLRARGCGPENRVGVLLERSSELLVALLGVLKAGAAYVPLDPDHPADRLAFQDRDAGLRLIVTRDSVANRLQGAEDRFLYLDKDGDSGPVAPLDRPVDPDHPAYILYTSGSTGRPKGAVISHRAIVNRLLWMQDALHLTADDRVLQKTPFSFDVSVWELFWPLMIGARLVVARPGGHRDNVYLARLIATQGITVLHFVPSMLQLFLEEPEAGECRSLRDVVCSGEALPAELARRFAARLGAPRGQTRLHNLYGPTEAAVDVTSWVCESADDDRGIPIGRPIANTRIHLLDHNLLPVPVGIPGELFIAGVNLARGYVERPDLTAERFLPDPQGGEPGGRVYRTGDLARWRADGAIEYLGRLDHQVKIRGFRIELGEIEAVLAALPGVREAVVVVRSDGDRRLVAYVTGEAPADALRQALRERLPDYMVPAAFVALAAMPHNANGKVDRKALPAPERQNSEETYLAPRTPVEEVLAGVWMEVLGRERIGAADHFFDLGGHSLLGTRVMSRLRSAFSVELPLRELFEAPTLAGLAARVEVALRDGQGLHTPPLIPVPRGGDLPLSFAQQRLLFLAVMAPGDPSYNLPLGLRLEGRLDVRALQLALDAVVARHEPLRTTFRIQESRINQVIASAAGLRLPLVDLAGVPAGLREAESRRLALEQARHPFDLLRGPVVIALLVRLAPTEHLLLLTVHHIAADGWSFTVLYRDMTELYQAIVEGRRPRLPELPVQYTDFAAWQRTELQEKELKRHLDYWRSHLAGARAPALPTDRPRPLRPSGRGATLLTALPAATVDAARRLARGEDATLFMVLLGAFAVVLHRATGCDDIVIGTDIANRNRRETEDLVGLFVNQLVLRNDLSGNPPFRELLRRVRRTTLKAYTHQDAPFDRLVEALNPVRDLGTTPLFQVKLVLQNASMPVHELEGLNVSPLGVHNQTAKFDLLLNLAETGDAVSGTLEYSADLWDEASMVRLLGDFATVLATGTARPDEHLGRIEEDLSRTSLPAGEERRTIRQRRAISVPGE